MSFPGEPQRSGRGLRPWISAARPKTLPAAVIPVLLGSGFALRDGGTLWPGLLICLIFALLVQIGTNYANDYFDFVKGADRDDRVGPKRAVVSGWVTPRGMLVASILVFLTAFCVGLVLVAYRGPVLLAVGVVSILFGFAYTGGPFPLAYRGLGDLFVLIFFGGVAVGGTYFVMTGDLTLEVMLAALPIGLLATNILVVNNYRDMETDARAAKRTLVVRYGRGFARAQYGISLLVVFALPVIFAVNRKEVLLLLPLLALPFGLRAWARLTPDRSPDELNGLLGASAGVLLIYGVCLAFAVTQG
ncbi:MAG: 1,4-dihydroxy-2-naphthoate polyprenyltransferase [Opitutaceae bacterium]